MKIDINSSRLLIEVDLAILEGKLDSVESLKSISHDEYKTFEAYCGYDLCQLELDSSQGGTL